jgi:hypothetical protein
MKWLRRLLGLLVVLLSTIGFIVCLAGIAGAWKLQQETSQKVEKITARVDVGLQRTSAVTENVRKALEKARADVGQVNKEAAGLGAGADKDRRTTEMIRRLIRQRVGPDIDEMRGRLDTFVDVSVALSSLLESLKELPAGESTPINKENVDRTADNAAQLTAVLRKLQATLGEDNQSANEREVTAATNEVERVLEKCQAMVDDWQADLESARTELQQLKARILGWILLAAVIVTAVCAWVGVSQISLFSHGWKWLRGA